MTEDELIAAIETTIEAAAQACEPYYGLTLASAKEERGRAGRGAGSGRRGLIRVTEKLDPEAKRLRKLSPGELADEITPVTRPWSR